MLISKNIQIEFANLTIKAIDAIHDIREGVRSASLNLYSRYGVQIQTPMVYGDDKVVVEVKIPEEIVNTFAIGPHLKGVATYLLKQCNGRYDNYKSVMNSLGYTSNNWHCVSANSAYGFLRNTNDIFTFVGHGLETTSGQGMATICFQNSSGGYNGYITTNGAIVNGSNDYAIDDLDKNALSLERFVLYLGCKTGQTYTVGETSYNLVQSTYDKGAHFVLGTLETITVSEAYSFLDTFLNNCSTKSVYDSISSILGDDPLFDAYYMGDSRQFIAVE